MTDEVKRPIAPDAKAYMCEVCEQVFAIEDPEAWDLCEANFEANKPVLGDGSGEGGGLSVVCDDCFRKFAAWYEATHGEKIVV